jgi:hypothetical protein
MLRLDAEKLRQAAQRKVSGVAAIAAEAAGNDEESFRRSEYKALREARGDRKSEFFVEMSPLADYEAERKGIFHGQRAASQIFSDKVGHSNCVILRDSCKLPDLHFPL